ncbi:hypothetical protein Tcan_02406 [Toxocara canis]|uniref:Uncharacterized protein n=1 Tax=Toxocara canis TaxID=6265 RepID=A0A0B2UJP8_TOXCA|nr:hypothetical protein Tcan_02406 [Toxocara canis]
MGRQEPSGSWLLCDDPTVAASDRKAPHLGTICVFWFITRFIVIIVSDELLEKARIIRPYALIGIQKGAFAFAAPPTSPTDTKMSAHQLLLAQCRQHFLQQRGGTHTGIPVTNGPHIMITLRPQWVRSRTGAH